MNMMNKVNGKKIFLIVIVALMLVFTGVTDSFASRREDISRKITKAEQTLKNGKKKVSEIEKIIVDLQLKIDEIEGQIVKLKKDILSTKSEIKSVDKQLKKSRKELKSNQLNLNKRLRNMYKGGTIGFVDVMLASDDVDALLSNAEMIKKIYSGDKDMMEKLRTECKKIKSNKEQLEKLKVGLESKETELKNKKQAVANTRKTFSDQKGKISAKNIKTRQLITSLHEDAAKSVDKNEIKYSGGKYSKGDMMWPCNGSVSCEFGPRICPFHGYEIHSGIDISAPTGTSVVAAKDGVVSLSGYSGGFGQTVKIYHGGGISTLYAHNSSLLVSSGQKVKKGQVIARVGSTGNSTGPHCHFSVIKNGNYVNPRNYL